MLEKEWLSPPSYEEFMRTKDQLFGQSEKDGNKSYLVSS